MPLAIKRGNSVLDIFGISFGRSRTGNRWLLGPGSVVLLSLDIFGENIERFRHLFLQLLVIINSGMISDGLSKIGLDELTIPLVPNCPSPEAYQ